MSDPIATYSFLPWLRQGLAGRITATDGDPAVKLRAGVKVDLELTGEALGGGTASHVVTRDVALYGPGDVVGIDARAIVRTEPRHWITNFEPNYLAHVEFYDEAFPWRYTPAAPNGHRLRPWIALLVLEEGEFEEGRDLKGKPLPYITVKDASPFPPADQLWAWAHVHVNRSLAANDGEFASDDMAAVLPKLQAVLSSNPDLACSRLVCPRRLSPNKAYHAFVIPVFETGRLAGLGGKPADAPSATACSWEPAAKVQQHPYYHRWFFRTGVEGDFESLVLLLEPRPVDKRVGTRDVDVQDPGSALPGIADPDLHGILKLGGALKVPRENYTAEELHQVEAYDQWATPYPHPFQEGLAAFVNLADDYAAQGAAAANAGSGFGGGLSGGPGDDLDPLVTPPIYAMWHAATEPPPPGAPRPLTKRLLTARDGTDLPNAENWLHELNLDPRFRVPAGFGTRLIQKEQEKYMDAAWEQLGRVLEANRRIRLGQVAKEVSATWHQRHLRGLHSAGAGRLLGLSAPLSKRILVDGYTLHHHFGESLVQPAYTAVVTRRALAPRRRLARAQGFTPEATPSNLVERVNEGVVTAAPPKVTPAGAVTVNEVADSLLPANLPPAFVSLLRRMPWLLWAAALFVLLLLWLLWLVAPGGVFAALLLPILVAAAVLLLWLLRLQRTVRRADSIREENQTPGAVDALPGNPDFQIDDTGPGKPPRPGTTDSPQGGRFKDALKDVFVLIGASEEVGRAPQRKRLDVARIADAVIKATDPERTVPRQIWRDVRIPPRIRAEMGEGFWEAMAYPEFDIPMYKPLSDISAELFLPNINLIEQNSLTLLETNQRFIEAYMVGLNHEFARELLWREYPTDQRGSYFRQFWDVAGYLDAEELGEAALKEKLRDIKPIHTWPRASKLGDHDNREAPGDNEEEVVLVIRGELLKRYPTAVIYAHRARWSLDENGQVDLKKERQLVELDPAEEAKPPRSKVRTPLYEAKVDPDIYFFGFDLTVEAAKGSDGTDPNGDPGWFFVIKERPSEPRFGLDLDETKPLNVWNDLSWANMKPDVPEGGFIQITNATVPLVLKEPTSPALAEKHEQWEDDAKVAWNKDVSSADLAYLLFQAPVMIAVHAAEMLTRK